MSEPVYRTIRMALRLGREVRTTEIKIQADTIPDGWELQPDGTHTHPALRSLLFCWAADQLELRCYTADSKQPRLLHIQQPADNQEHAVQRASENTRTPPSPPTPEQLCDRCGGELEEQPEPWQQPADAWRRK